MCVCVFSGQGLSSSIGLCTSPISKTQETVPGGLSPEEGVKREREGERACLALLALDFDYLRPHMPGRVLELRAWEGKGYGYWLVRYLPGGHHGNL